MKTSGLASQVSHLHHISHKLLSKSEITTAAKPNSLAVLLCLNADVSSEQS